jgi:integrase
MIKRERKGMVRMGKHRGKGEGSIYKRSDGRWAADITIEGRRRKALYGRTREEVHEKLLAAQHEKRQGLLRTGPKQTVKDYLNFWLEVMHRPKIKVSTYALYRQNLDNHLIPALGHIQLHRLTTDQVQSLCADKLRNGFRSGTVRLMYRILHVALKDAVRKKRLALNVCDAVDLPRLMQHEIQPLTMEQAQKLLYAARQSRLECLLTVAIVTGMRLGELLALRWSEFDLTRGMLQVRHTVNRIKGFGITESEPKTESSKRSILLPPFVIDSLVQHRASQNEARIRAGAKWQELDLVFPNTQGGYFRRPKLHTMYKNLLKEAGLPDIRFHDLRHCAATIFLSMGVHPKIVQELLGHSDITLTLRVYSHVLPSMQQEAMNKLDTIFRGKE